jgi:phage tail-like protein
MTRSPSMTAPPVGRDPNDATWMIVRYARDWAQAKLDGVAFDAARHVLELVPETSAAGEVLPRSPARDHAGNLYRVDSHGALLLRQAACENELVPVAGIGGHGWETGRMRRPTGLAFDARDWLYIADTGNHRVQVVRLDSAAGPNGTGSVTRGQVVAVLGASDAWGRPMPGSTGAAMQEPVAVAVCPLTSYVYVADRAAGRILVFDARFVWRHGFTPTPALPRPPGMVSQPLALAATPRGTLVIADGGWPRLLHACPDGTPLADVTADALDEVLGADHPARAALLEIVARGRYRARGSAVIGPLDSGVHDMRWHRVLLDLDAPSGSRVEVQTFAANDSAIDSATMPWAPRAPVAMPMAGEDPAAGELSRLVLSDTQRWQQTRYGDYRRARPRIAEYAGDGPASGSTLRLSAPALRLVRAGDGIAFEISGTPGVAGTAIIASVPARAASFRAAGSARVYGPGTDVFLLERDALPAPGAARWLTRLTSGEIAALAAVPTNGDAATADLPHSVSAFLHQGDVIELRQGGDRLALSIDSVAWSAADITLTQPLAGSFSHARLYLVDAPGRLLVRDGSFFAALPPLHEPITVHGDAASAPAMVRLAEPQLATLAHGDEVGALWLEPGSLGPGVTFETWTRATPAAPEDTDRGRYLWIRLVLTGSSEPPRHYRATATPAVRSARALMPRLPYTRYLPATYSRRDDRRDASGAVFLERFLAIFEGALTRVEEAYESVARLLNPAAADDEWLTFLACWLDLVFDPSWSLERRRRLVLEADEIYRRRGTPWSLSRYVEIYTGKRPEILEGFRVRPAATLVLGRTGPLGCRVLGSVSDEESHSGAHVGAHAHRFTLFVFLDEACERELAEGAVRRIVDTVKPAHTDYHLCFVLPAARVGLQSTVGLDFVLGTHSPPETILGQGVAPGAGHPRPVLGQDTRLGRGQNTPSPGPAGPRLAPGGIVLDRGERLT